MTKKELAAAMRLGVTTYGVKESSTHYVDSTTPSGFCMACALGCAFIGKHGGDYRLAEGAYDEQIRSGDDLGSDVLARLLGISGDLADEIEWRHLDGSSVEQIATWLESETE